MSAIAPIKTASLPMLDYTNSATVGVDKTFDPEGFILPGVARWVDRSGGIPAGFPAISMSVRPPTKVSRIYKVTVKVSLPTLEQTSASTATGIQPAPQKAYECLAVMEFMLPERSTAAERTAFLNHVKSLFCVTIAASDNAPSDNTGSPLVAAIQNLEQVY